MSEKVYDLKDFPEGVYVVKAGMIYKVTPKIATLVSKRVNIFTGEVTYPTNGDKIRNMGDKDFAKWFCDDVVQMSCSHCPALHTECCEEGWAEDCHDRFMKWLKSEVKDDES